jgi:hypothetical protein
MNTLKIPNSTAAVLLVILAMIGAGAADMAAQDREEHHQSYHTDGHLINEFKDSYWTDEFGRDIEHRRLYRESPLHSWSRSNRYRWEYDDRGRVTKREVYEPIKETGMPEANLYRLRSVHSTVYSEGGLRTVFIEQRVDADGSLTNFSRSIYDQDAQGRLVFRTVEYWIDGSWQSGYIIEGNRAQTSTRVEYAYNANSSVVTTSAWSLNRSDWVPQNRRTEHWSVDEDSIRTLSVENWRDGYWELQLEARTQIRHFQEGQHSGRETTNSLRIGEEWIPTTRSLRYEDDVTSDITHYSWRWENNEWMPRSWTDLFYSENGLESRMGYRWANDGWEVGGRSTYVFDADGRLIDERTEVTKDGAWITTFWKTVNYPMATNRDAILPRPSVVVGVAPNPSAGSVVLHYTFERTTPDRLRIVNVSGREVRSMPWPGSNALRGQLPLDLTNLPAGMYFLSMEGESGVQTVPVVLF